jgi:hypothetical protein
MKLRARLFITGIFVLLCVIGAQSRPATAATTPCPNGAAGPFNVYILGPGFQPSLPYNATPMASSPTYAPPTSSTFISLTLPPVININPPTPAMVSDLGAAFSIAPTFLLKELCGLDGIFINTNDCTSFDISTDVCSGSLTPENMDRLHCPGPQFGE